MKTIRLTKTGKAISDFEISSFVDEIQAADDETEFNISTGLVIDEIRARIVEERIGLNDLEIMVEDEFGLENFYNIDKDGRSTDWQQVQDVGTNIMSRILCGRAK